MAVLTSRTGTEAAALLAEAPSPIVVIPIYNAFDEVMCCLEAVFAHTCSSVAILVVDDAGADRRAVCHLNAASARMAHRVVVLEHRENVGFVRSCNEAFAATPGRDVVLVNSDVIVGPEWLDRLKAAALSSDSIATATTLTNHGTILSMPDRNRPTRTLPDHMTPAEAARRIAAGSRRLRPSIPTAIGHCFYIRRHAIDLVGPFDEAFSPGYGEEVDFSQRAVAHGFRHVVADDVFTYHRGGSSFGEGPAVVELRYRHEAIVQQRYPSYALWGQWAGTDEGSTLADALSAARRSLLGVIVGVDAMCLGSTRMGTQNNVLATIHALARRSEIKRLVAFVPMHPSPDVEKARKALPEVECVGLDFAEPMPERVVDLLYRPYQVTSEHELEFLRRAADRFVVNQLDTIAFENPIYFANYDDWLAYRNVTRLTLGLADGVAFPSRSAHQAAEAAGLLDAEVPCAIVSCGSDVSFGDEPDAGDQPGTRSALCSPNGNGFLFCIGASYLHKNLRFALELWAELRRRGWPGRIVLAGPAPPHGNSRAREAEFLLTIPDLRADVVTLGAVTDAERRWLYRHAALVLYPSSVEGFGLVPFEAAAHGVPTLATRQGSLDEVLPRDIPVLDGFDVCRGADRAWALLHDASAASHLTRAIQERGRSFAWSATAEQLVNLFDRALAHPRSRLLLMEGEGGKRVGPAAREEAEHLRALEASQFLKARLESELVKAGEEIARLKERQEAELLGVRAEIATLTAQTWKLQGELAAVRGTRTWWLRERLVRSTVLRSLFARRTPVHQ